MQKNLLRYSRVVQGLEKYVMLKLFNRVFAASPEDAEADLRISKKILLLQHFVKPDHLDLPGNFQIEASWLVCYTFLETAISFPY